MFRRIHTHKAQTTLEYAILIGVIVAALIAMQTYVKRGFQGKLRENADNMGEQFAPLNTTYTYNTNSSSNSTETIADSGVTNTEITGQTSAKTGSEDVTNATGDGWWQKYGK